MLQEWLSRTTLLIGDEGVKKLKNAHVLICGMGGVGSWAAEFICRAGVGEISIVDHDIVKHSNINRQLPAMSSTLGLPKTDIIAARLKDINPELKLNVFNMFLRDDATKNLIMQLKPDFIIDAIDTLSPKVFLVHFAVTNNFKIVSSLGAGGKLDPSKIRISDISESEICRLAYYMRKKLRRLGVSDGFKVVFSTEVVKDETIILVEDESNKKSTVGTISFIPAIFGGFCASVVINDLIS